MIDVLAIDPGEKCGWAHGGIDRASRLHVLDHGIEHWKPFVMRLEQDIHEFDVVIYERFRLQAWAANALIGNDMQTSQCIGAIRSAGWRHSVKLLAQDPKDYKHGWTVAPPTVRAILDILPKSHDESHDGPALGHLAHYWFKCYFDPTKEGL